MGVCLRAEGKKEEEEKEEMGEAEQDDIGRTKERTEAREKKMVQLVLSFSLTILSV